MKDKQTAEETIKKYKCYVDNIEWHIRTNKPTEVEIKLLNIKLDTYNEVINDLERLEYAGLGEVIKEMEEDRSSMLVKETWLPKLKALTSLTSGYYPHLSEPTIDARQIDEDLINKLSCLLGYLEIWQRGGKYPLEMNDVIKEANEYLSTIK